jgi:hypothetical protein
MDDADGSFAEIPVDPYISLTEDAVIKGRYELDESRTVWTDGLYTVAIYNQSGGAPAPASDTIIGTGPAFWAIKDDAEIYLAAPAAEESTLDEIKGIGWLDETLVEIKRATLTRLASTPFATEHSPTTENVTDGTVLSGGVAQLQTINQEYLKVQETGKFKIDTTYTLIDELHEKFFLTYRYFGAGSSNHRIKLKIWNYITLAWDDVTAETRDLPATDIDTTLIFSIPGTLSDYYSGTIPNLSAQLRIEHESNASDTHFFWLDAIGFGDLEIIYTAPDNAGILANGEAIDALPTLGEITGEIQNGTFTRIAVTGDPIQIIKGNFKTIQIDLGVEWDLTDKRVYFVMSKSNSSDTPIVNRLVDRITDAPNGLAEIDLLTTETTPQGCYEYQVELRNDPADDEPETAMEGTAEITENLRS